MTNSLSGIEYLESFDSSRAPVSGMESVMEKSTYTRKKYPTSGLKEWPSRIKVFTIFQYLVTDFFTYVINQSSSFIKPNTIQKVLLNET